MHLISRSCPGKSYQSITSPYFKLLVTYRIGRVCFFFLTIDVEERKLNLKHVHIAQKLTFCHILVEKLRKYKQLYSHTHTHTHTHTHNDPPTHKHVRMHTVTHTHTHTHTHTYIYIYIYIYIVSWMRYQPSYVGSYQFPTCVFMAYKLLSCII